jgi:xanthine/uracil/vitamin C permease (AzgA family)
MLKIITMVKRGFNRYKAPIAAGVGGVAAAASPALATGGDWTDVTGYATTNVPLAITAIIGLFLLFMGLPLAKMVYKNVSSLISGAR